MNEIEPREEELEEAEDAPVRAPELHEAVAEAGAAGERLDRWAAARWPDLSRSRLKALIEEGRLTLDGAPVTTVSAKVRPGGRYALSVPAPAPAKPEPENIPLTVLYEDADLIVIDKPAGLTVHPGVGAHSGTLVHALLHHCRGQLSGIGGVERPGIVHRLDKETSGVLVAAKSDAAHRGLSEMFAAHDIERVYLAAVRGAPKPREGRIETRIARSAGDRKKMAVVRNAESEAGKLAITNYETLETYGQEPNAPAGTPAASLLECRLETGRTHQIRVHLAHIGCPVLGDPVYGKARGARKLVTRDGEPLPDLGRQALHAAVLGFVHPITGEELRFESEMPEDMAALIEALERL
jgi:23S rRNA pseudouridine1911/1915/1917 synthase